MFDDSIRAAPELHKTLLAYNVGNRALLAQPSSAGSNPHYLLNGTAIAAPEFLVFFF